MKKLIQRQKVPKYLGTSYKILFIPEYGESEPIEICEENFQQFKEQCGDWYTIFPLSVGDHIYLGDSIAKIVKLGKKNAKLVDFNDEVEKIPLKYLIHDYKEIKVKIPQ